MIKNNDKDKMLVINKHTTVLSQKLFIDVYLHMEAFIAERLWSSEIDLVTRVLNTGWGCLEFSYGYIVGQTVFFNLHTTLVLKKVEYKPL